MKLICCFCEKYYSENVKFCGNCDEYKGLMSISDFEMIYGDKRPVWR